MNSRADQQENRKSWTIEKKIHSFISKLAKPVRTFFSSPPVINRNQIFDDGTNNLPLWTLIRFLGVVYSLPTLDYDSSIQVLIICKLDKYLDTLNICYVFLFLILIDSEYCIRFVWGCARIYVGCVFVCVYGWRKSGIFLFLILFLLWFFLFHFSFHSMIG